MSFPCDYCGQAHLSIAGDYLAGQPVQPPLRGVGVLFEKLVPVRLGLSSRVELATLVARGPG